MISILFRDWRLPQRGRGSPSPGQRPGYGAGPSARRPPPNGYQTDGTSPARWSCTRHGLNLQSAPFRHRKPAVGASPVTRWLTGILAANCLAVVVGCQIPSSSRSAASGLGPSGSPEESAFNPLGSIEKSLVFAPSRYPVGNWQPAGLAFEDAWFTASTARGCTAGTCRTRSPGRSCSSVTATAATWPLWADVLRILHDRMGVAVMGFDYRGYGRSEGTPSEAGVLADARAARAWLARRAGIAENQIVLMGRVAGRGRGRRSGGRRRPRPGAGKHLHLDARGGHAPCPGCRCGR